MTFETLISRLFRDKVGMRPDRSLSWHGVGPVDMTLETKGFRGLSVLIP